MEPEDGELSSSSDEVYTPLQRPDVIVPKATENKMTEIHDDPLETNSSSEGSSDNCLKDNKSDRRKKRSKRTVLLRVQRSEDEAQKRAKFKKYNIWTATAEEEALTENMRGCDVRHSSVNYRSVETYNYKLVNGRKRRRDGMLDDDDDEMYPTSKRGRDSSRDSDSSEQRKSLKSRLVPRLILDLDDTNNREPSDIGREMANKLFEEKDELLMRIVEVLGIDISLEIYKETQRIEADGGMMVNEGTRRRTPGGVFLFLMKHHDNISDDDRKSIFEEDKQNLRKQRKDMDSAIRDRKVAELKQRLRKHEHLPSLSSRKDLHLSANVNVESQSTLSNPPPSPVAGQESSPEYKDAQIINDVSSDVLPNKATDSMASNKDLNSPNDDLDFLDLNCGDMDLF